MPKRGAYYCVICWQEFKTPIEHGAGSYFDRARLNGYCPGDIRKREAGTQPRPQYDPSLQPTLGFSGEPIEIS